MARAAGLLTARGGIASHAAVVARGWGIAAVVGLEGLELDATGFTLNGHRIAIGETISLDGRTGRVYAGAVTASEHVVPEAMVFRTWARDLGMEIEVDLPSERSKTETSDRVHVDTGEQKSEEHADAESFLHTLSIRGSAMVEALAEIYSLEISVASALLEELEVRMMIGPDRMLGWILTEAGQRRVAELLHTDQLTAGSALVDDALDGFQPLDARFKQTVTDWQLRTVNGELTPNDHEDLEWDKSVFARLSLLDAALGPWLGMLRHALPRLAQYQTRFSRALDAAQGGDGRYVASPRVDSMHGIWFELHEDLIRLADSTRAAELAEGRAG